METRRWLNQSQPHTLQNATVLFYINAAFAVLNLLTGRATIGLLTLAGVAAGYGIANERKWGYKLAIVVAIVPFALNLLVFVSGRGLGGVNTIISLMFQGLLVVLVLHPMSRDYQRVWFK